MDGFYMQRGSPHMPCKACRSTYRPVPRAVAEKRCSKCDEVKPVDDFGVQSRKATGRSSWCLACTRAYRPPIIVVPAEKRCPVCKLTRSADDYYRDNRHADGLYARCKQCHNARAYPGQKRYHAENKERVTEWSRASRARRSPEQKAAEIERLNEWGVLHPEAKAVRQNRRRARATSGANDLTREQWAALKLAYGFRCVYCDKKTKRLTMDHVVPLSKGGEHTARNIVPACGPCNSKKNAGPAPTHQPLLVH
jgi:5-methylcytosine-specific restriction endonuclease McrA